MGRIVILSDAHLLMQARRSKDEDYIAPGGEVSLRNFSRAIIDILLEERPEAVILAGVLCRADYGQPIRMRTQP